MAKPQKILVVHASVGSGHKTAAKAIAQAIDLLQKEAGLEQNYEAEVLDILDFARLDFDGNKVATSFTGATRPVYDFSWRYTFTGRFLWGGGTSWSHVMFPDFTKLVREEKPAAIICTHITAANAAVGAKIITHQNFPVVCVPTDYEVEGLWPHTYTDLFCVANEAMAETLRARHIQEYRIRITGMPCDPAFIKKYNKRQARKEFGLPNDKQVVLVMTGASLPQPYVHIKKLVAQLVPFMHEFDNLHFAIVVGKDAEFKDLLNGFIADHGLTNVSVFGYVEEVAKLMSASDLVVCKAGGMTVTECLCADTSMILACRAYGQEKANVKMLTGCGAAMHVTTSRELYTTLRIANGNPHAYDGIKQAAKLIRKPNASLDIAKETFFLISNGTVKRPGLFASFYFGDKPAHTR